MNESKHIFWLRNKNYFLIAILSRGLILGLVCVHACVQQTLKLPNYKGIVFHRHILFYQGFSDPFEPGARSRGFWEN